MSDASCRNAETTCQNTTSCTPILSIRSPSVRPGLTDTFARGEHKALRWGQKITAHWLHLDSGDGSEAAIVDAPVQVVR